MSKTLKSTVRDRPPASVKLLPQPQGRKYSAGSGRVPFWKLAGKKTLVLERRTTASFPVFLAKTGLTARAETGEVETVISISTEYHLQSYGAVPSLRIPMFRKVKVLGETLSRTCCQRKIRPALEAERRPKGAADFSGPSTFL